MNTRARLPIAVTCGDPAGIGPIVIARYLQEHPQRRADLCVIGPRAWLKTLPQVQTCAVGDHGFTAHPGTPSIEAAAMAAEALEEAALGCRQGRYRAVVTAPVSKTWMNRTGWNYPGQTEYFADRWFGKPSMAFAGGRLCVVLATWHIPLGAVPASLSDEVIERAVRNAAFLAERLRRAKAIRAQADGHRQATEQTDGHRQETAQAAATASAATPLPPAHHHAATEKYHHTFTEKMAVNLPDDPLRIGVCGLNPHAGEDGLLGFEEQGIIDPLLDTLRGEFPGLSRCLPGDTVFWRQLQGEFDVVIAMYHDQGLAPLKTLEFDQSVNITLGLPFIRTSPDHGTAFALAAQPDPQPDITSFARAVELADELSYAV